MTIKNISVTAETENKIKKYVDIMKAAGVKNISIKSVMERLIEENVDALSNSCDGFSLEPPALDRKLDWGIPCSIAVVGKDVDGNIHNNVVYLGVGFGWCVEGDFGRKIKVVMWKRGNVPPPPPSV